MNSGDRNPRPATVRGESAPHPARAAVSPRLEPIGSPDSFKRRAYAALKDAIASFDRGAFIRGANQLKAFQNKVRTQIAPRDPALANALIQAAQEVLGTVGRPKH